MPVIIWIALGVIILTTILLAIAMSIKKKENTKPDYYAFFVIGIVWAGAGIPIGNWGISALGFIFMLIGIVNKDKWKENRRSWNTLGDKEKKLRLFVILFMGFLVLLGVLFFFLVQNRILFN